MQAIAEAVALGLLLDLPRDLLFDTLAKTAVVAPAHTGKLSSAKRDDYAAQFPLRLMRKDFGLVLDAAAHFLICKKLPNRYKPVLGIFLGSK